LGLNVLEEFFKECGCVVSEDDMPRVQEKKKNQNKEKIDQNHENRKINPFHERTKNAVAVLVPSSFRSEDYISISERYKYKA
jgi:hypothetical protein